MTKIQAGGLKLMLLRHAKSSWGDPGLDDRDRPLNARGKASAQAMGRVMRHRGLLPDLVLCSPARRAKDTWTIAAAEMKTAPKIVFSEDVYDFGNGGKLAELIRGQNGKARSLLLVGHNPSMERLAQRLAGKGDKKLRERLEKKYPTGALAVFEADLDAWGDFAEPAFTMTHFIRPRDVMTGD
jgi:phosphohistidine phosphatase